jgi:peptidoglycan/LPS O-acetylase OafA/YrhL
MSTENVTPVQTNQKFRYPELDALRGIAVLSVLFCHYTFGYDYHFKINGPNRVHFVYGFLAVHLFFIISGFVIFMTLERSKKKTDFLVSRFSRLYPAYWASILLTTLIITLFPIPTLGHYTVTEVLANFTMFQGFNKHIRLIDQVYWTLKFELTFYIIMYILYLTNNLKRITLFCFIWLAVSLASILFNIPGKKFLDVLLILRFAPLFIAGINFYRLKKNNKEIVSHILVFLSFLVELLWAKLDTDLISYSSVVIILFSFYAIFYLFVYRGLPWLNNKVLVFFGTISYSLYLLHNVIGHVIIYKLRAMLDSQLFYVPITFVLVVLLSVFVSFCIEKPAMKIIRNWYKKLGQPKPDLEISLTKN